MPDPGAPPLRFAVELVAALRRAGAARLTGCYLHGSAVLGGWHPSRSDVDLLIVVDDWSPPTQEAVTGAVTSMLSRCPGRGLELSIVDANAARTSRPPWPFLLHVDSTGHAPRVVDGATTPGDDDLLVHYAVTRAHGLAVAGPTARDVFGEVSRAEVLGYLREELEWGLAHGSEAYAVLNAMRAIAFARSGVLLSKVAAGTDALTGTDAPVDVVRRPLRQQQGTEPPATPGTDAERVVRHAQTALATALANPTARD